MQVLALLNATPGVQPEAFLSYQHEEEQTVWRHWRAGLIRQMWFRTDRLGAVFILETESLETAHAILREFPMVHDELLQPELVPLRNFDGLEALFAPQSATAASTRTGESR